MLERPLSLRHTKSSMASIKDLVDIKSYKQNRQSKALRGRQATALFPFHTRADQAMEWWFLGLRRLSKDRQYVDAEGAHQGSYEHCIKVQVIWAAQREGVLRIASQPYVISRSCICSRSPP